MNTHKSNSIYLVHVCSLLGAISLVIGLLYVGRDVLVPLVSAALVAFLLMPVIQRMERWIGTTAAAIATVSVITSLIFMLLLWIILVNITALSRDIPDIQQSLIPYAQASRDAIQNYFDIPIEEYVRVLMDWISTSVGTVTQITYQISTTIVYGIGACVFFIFYVIFFILYRHRFMQFLLMSVAEQDHTWLYDVVYRVQKTLSSYLTGIVTIIIMLAIYNGIALTFIGVPYALLWAIVGAILYLIPYIGITIGAIFPALATLALEQDVTKALVVISIFVINQVIENNILTPYIVGGHVRINPLFVLIAFFAGSQIWGVSGMILFLPMLAVVKVICDHVPSLHAYGYVLGTNDVRSEDKE